MPTIYYIDGYNVLHKSSKLRPLAMKDFEAARDALVEQVAAYCTAVGKRAVIVFDGRGDQKHPERALPKAFAQGLEILYSPKDVSADAVIERLIYKSAHRLDLVVVSNDRGLRDLCRNLGALTMEADNFIESLRESREDTSQTLKSLQRTMPADHLEDRLGSDALERLKQLRDKL